MPSENHQNVVDGSRTRVQRLDAEEAYHPISASDGQLFKNNNIYVVFSTKFTNLIYTGLYGATSDSSVEAMTH